jgi:hypothetical protein
MEHDQDVPMRWLPPPQRTVRLELRVIDGAFFISSPDVPGVLAAHVDAATAWREVGEQLALLSEERADG